MCEFELPDVSLRCFVARQLLLRIYALSSVKFSGLKLWLCKKCDKYEVWRRTTLIFNTLFSLTERYLNIWAFHEGGSGNIGGAGACWEWVVHKRPNTPVLLSRFALPISNNATVKLSSLFRGVYFEYHFTPQLLTRFACPVLNQVREHVAWVLLYFVSLPFST